jgi:predicted TIM-barrel fold metal-dependent hydrolase
MIETGLDLGVPNFAVHKGLPIPGFDVEHNAPTDVGPVAKDYPEANFIIYHSGIHSGTGESVFDAISPPETEDVPFDPSDPSPLGVNVLIKSLMDHGIGVGSNVYAELGSAWSNVARNPVSSQHLIGKLLKYLGEDNVVWGTDAIITGSPQWQIEAFRSFQITPEYQDRFGYPELTDEVKAKIFGLNAARIFRVDPERERCKVGSSDFAMVRERADSELGPRRWTAKPPLGPTTRREFLRLAKESIARGTPS